MLDANQIKDWDGKPDKAAPAPPVQPFGEATFTGERIMLTPEQAKARKRRGQWIALALFAFCIVVFLLTMTKMGANMLVGGGS
jgi:hypothetical protein